MWSEIDFSRSIIWNLFLLTTGSVLFAVGINGLALPHNLIHGGMFGVSLLLNYAGLNIPNSLLFLLLNIPLFFIGRVKVGKAFFNYTLYATIVTTIALAFIHPVVDVRNELYAGIAGGIVCGAGAGIVLRSLGSGGGLDIVAVILYRTYNLGIGKFYFIFNLCVFTAAFFMLNPDRVIASLIMVFITSVVMDQVLALFSQRKIVYVISDFSQDIAKQIMHRLGAGCTLLHAEGAYTGRDKKVIMTVVNNIQLKKLEHIVYTEDENAVFIVENTFNVIGSGFSKRKNY